MLKDKQNSRKQGDVGLGAAIEWFTRQGQTVCVPLTDSQKYDLVVDFDGELKKIQVKTSTFKRHDKYEVMLKTCGGNKSGYKTYLFDKHNVDYLFILTEEGARYLIPTASMTSKTSVVLGSRYDKYLL